MTFPRRTSLFATSYADSSVIALLYVAITMLLLPGCSGVSGPSNESHEVERQLPYPVAAPANVELRSRGIVEQAGSGQVLVGDTLPELVAYALQNSPAIEHAVARYKAQHEKIPQANALPDPRLNFRYFIEEVETRVGPQDYALGLSQPLPWFGKLNTQGKAAETAARAAQARVGVAQNDVIASVAKSWYELFYYGRSLKIIRGNRDLVLYLERVARSRYSTGTTGHPDVIRAQVELGKIENELASLEDRKAPLLAKLNGSLNLPSYTPLEIPTEVPFHPIKASDEDILEQVISTNPNLQALNLDIEFARERKNRASKDFFPDFSVGIDYIATDEARMPGVSGSGNDPVSASISMTIPLQREKYRAGVREAEANVASFVAKRDNLLNTLHADTVNALFRLRDAERQIGLYQDTLIPKAKESLAATQRSYSAGGASFIDLIDAQRMLLTFELSETRALTDYNQSKTELEKLIGAPLATNTTMEEPSHDK